MYGSETMIWIRTVQMDNLRVLLGIRRMDKVPNARIRELCGVTKVWTKRLMKVFSYASPMWKEWRTTGLLEGHVGDCAGSVQWVGRGRGELIP